MMVIPDSHASRITRDELRALFELAMRDELWQPPDVVYLPPSLFDRAEREGYNMHGYAKQPLMPISYEPGSLTRLGNPVEPPPEARLGTRKNIHGYPGTHATRRPVRKHITEKTCHGKECACMSGLDGKCVACADDD